MGSENLTPVATLIGYPASKPAAEHRSPRLQARRGAAVRDRAGSARGRAAVGPQPTFEPLPAPDFMVHLQREKRRAERAERPLSLVVYRLEAFNGSGTADAFKILDVLREDIRETDIVGVMDENMVAVLCPDTDQEGMKAFTRKIADACGLPLATSCATYPDQLFETLGQHVAAEPDLQTYMLSEPTRQHGYVLKRAIDVAGALVALCLFAPIMLLVAIAVATTSRGPVIFTQTRLGRGGRPFAFHKFRSMVTHMDDAIHREYVASLIKGEARGAPQEGEPALYKLAADPRVTRVGRFIRKTSLDELPQLFNVLKGDMSLVGPRPPIPYEAANYKPWHLRRMLSAKPGLTGLWQVEGRSRVTFNEMVRMDLRYIRECSFVLDVKILLKTVTVVLRGEGAS